MTFHQRRWRSVVLVLGWTAAALLVAAATWNGGIAMDLMVAIMSVIGVFTSDVVLPLSPDWLGMAGHLAAAALAVVIGWRTLRHQRLSQDRCGRCGRGGGARPDRRRFARGLAYMSIVPACGYAVLKLHWAFGGTTGLVDPAVFAGIRPWTPGFADTAIEAAVGIAIAVAMSRRWPIRRWLLLTPAVIGCAMLLPMAVFGNLGNLSGLVNGFDAGDPLMPWVRWFVYGCFAVWGVCLAVITVEYHYATRGRCRVCGRGVSGSAP